MFKKTKIAAATVALLSAAAMQNASAVAIDESGTNAQVLIFPYYNTNGSFQSAFNIRNTKNETKAVKIRIRESKLSNDVLDFNVYMSPYDHFSFSLTPNADGKAVLSTADTTCTYPTIPTAGQPLKGDIYKSTNTADTREGYIEVIEMGIVTSATVQTGVKHGTDKKPKDCTVVDKAWTDGTFTEGGANANVVVGSSAAALDTARIPNNIKTPTGGLQGWSFLLDIAKGNANVAMPVAIRNYQTAHGQHYVSDNVHTFLLPSLASGNDVTSNVMSNDGASFVNTPWPLAADYVTTTAGTAEVALNSNGATPDASGINPYPISHVLAATAVSNDYLVTSATAPDSAGTDWVVTFPMRKHGVFSTTTTTTTGGVTTVAAASTATAIKIGGAFYDREESLVAINNGAGFSPVATTPADTLTREVNVLSFGLKTATTATRVLNSAETKNYGVDYQAGWGTVAFTSAFNTNKDTSGVAVDLKGVPAIGFAAIRGNFAAGDQNVIGESIPHNFTRNR